MLLWHLGVAAALVYVTLGRQRIDYRAILLGAVVPDLVDGFLGLFLFEGPSGRWIAHTLMAPVVVAIVIVAAARGTTRLALFGVPVGWLTHLVADAMWRAPETFMWPLFGTDFARAPAEPYSWDLLTDPLAHGWTWAGELAGLVLLAWFWVAFGLGHDGRARLFVRDGYLRPWPTP
jgi:hypothetical protein